MFRAKSCSAALFLALFTAVACNKPSDDAMTTQIKAKMYSEPQLKASSVSVT